VRPAVLAPGSVKSLLRRSFAPAALAGMSFAGLVAVRAYQLGAGPLGRRADEAEELGARAGVGAQRSEQG
jgi:hypothetical protein